LGAVNTGVLILSSFTMAMAVYFTQVGKQRQQIICLGLTLILGLTFLGVKAKEYHDKYEDHLIPGRLIPGNPFNPVVAQHGDDDPHKLHLLEGATVKKVEMFYWIYFAMTGMHALHMIIGAGLLTFLLIFLFPLLYLLGRHFEHG